MKRILITAGATFEPIDSVRGITNLSTGRTACAVAEGFLASGHHVVFVAGRGCRQIVAFEGASLESIPFVTYGDLRRILEERLRNDDFDVIVHAAAVSDFSVSTPISGKMTSGGPMTIELAPNPKLIHKLKRWSRNRDVKIIAFKLTSGLETEAENMKVRTLFGGGDVDLVVHNRVEDRSMDGARAFRVLARGGAVGAAETPEELGRILEAHPFASEPLARSSFDVSTEVSTDEIPL